eukprot:s1761_g19.t1
MGAALAALVWCTVASPDFWKADPCDATAALEDLGWLQQYIKIGFFTDYRNQAWHYYSTNETTYAFLWLNSISYANLDFVREACPEAAQLALLLRAEERLPAREADLPLLDFSESCESESVSVVWCAGVPVSSSAGCLVEN